MAITLPPRCAARYRTERLIAAGGFGGVVEAIQLGLDRRVALKLLNNDVLTDEDSVRRFLAEAKLTAALTHPYIVRVLDHDVEDGIPWIAYELIEGGTLRDLLEDGPPPWSETCRIGLQVGSALAYAHGLGALHRDIKPPNVLCAGDSVYKVTDFGLAKWTSQGGVKTQTGMMLGTPTYMAPELLANAVASPASDVYAVGILLFELLTGRVPFHGSSLTHVAHQHANAPVPSIQAENPEVPPELEAIVRRALAKVPQERPTAEELSREMERLRGGTFSASEVELNVAAMTELARETAAIPKPEAPGSPRGAGSTDAGEPDLGIPPGLRPGPRSPSLAPGSPRGAGSPGARRPSRLVSSLVVPPPRAPTAPRILVAAATTLLAVAMAGVIAARRHQAGPPASPATDSPAASPLPAASAAPSLAELLRHYRAYQNFTYAAGAVSKSDREKPDGLFELIEATRSAETAIDRERLRKRIGYYVGQRNQRIRRLSELAEDIAKRLDQDRGDPGVLVLACRVSAHRFRAESDRGQALLLEQRLPRLRQHDDELAMPHGMMELARLLHIDPALRPRFQDYLSTHEQAVRALAGHPERADDSAAAIFSDLAGTARHFSSYTWAKRGVGEVDREVHARLERLVVLPEPLGPELRQCSLDSWDVGFQAFKMPASRREQAHARLARLGERFPDRGGAFPAVAAELYAELRKTAGRR